MNSLASIAWMAYCEGAPQGRIISNISRMLLKLAKGLLEG